MSNTNSSNNGLKLAQQQQPQRIHFLQALALVKLPAVLTSDEHGVPVLQVAANGRTEAVRLRFSADKFTLIISAEPNNSNQSQNKSFFSSFWGTSSSNTASSPSSASISTTSTNSNNQNYYAIDVGEMDRIQRGQSTQQFEMAKKSRKGSSTTSDVMVLSLLQRNTSSTTADSTVVVSHTHSQQQQQDQSQQQPHQLDPQRSFSIIFRGAHTLDLMALSWSSREEICDALDRILEAYQRAKTRVADDVRLLRYVWLDVVTTGGTAGNVTLPQMARVFGQINFYMKPRDLQTSYEKFGKVLGLDRKQRRTGLSFEQLADFLHYVRRNSWIVKPVTVIWNELFGEIMNNGKLRETVSDKTFLEKFLRGKQGDGKASIVDVRKIFRKLHDMEMAHTAANSSSRFSDLNRINKDQFEAFLLASDNDAFDPEREAYNASDMDQPLAEYFINSSHNTYLIGDQYTSQSSVEMYSNALYRGCRCLELDIWDGGKLPNSSTPNPVVWHGHTMTTKINFVDIIRTIKVFLNFHPDTFPIILSFENHCSIPYQEVMAQHLVQILGDALYIPKEASLYGELPSPTQLRGMVIIKGRRPDGTEADGYDTDDDSDDERPVPPPIGDHAGEQEAKREQVIRHGVAPELARLTLFHGNKHESWDESLKNPTHHMHSFSENKVRSKSRQKQAYKWVVYNQRHMSRTYPAGSRVDSSNYNPLLAWSLGCQMVALNFQTQDAFLRLNDGRFRENGNCGYVLKPSALMIKNGIAQSGVPLRLSIRVLSGSCLPKPKGQRIGDCIDPYVKVSVFDVKNEEKETVTEFPTGVVRANGFNPIWSQDKFTFIIENWPVAMLQLTVFDKTKDEFIASASIPVSCLRRGIRSVKLFDATNTRSGAFDFASLLLDIKIGQVVAEI